MFPIVFAAIVWAAFLEVDLGARAGNDFPLASPRRGRRRRIDGRPGRCSRTWMGWFAYTHRVELPMLAGDGRGTKGLVPAAVLDARSTFSPLPPAPGVRGAVAPLEGSGAV